MSKLSEVQPVQVKPPFRAIDFAPPLVEVEHRPDGGMVLRSPVPLGAHDRSLGAMLDRWAAADPERPCLAEREGEGWRRLSFGAARAQADAVAEALLARG